MQFLSFGRFLRSVVEKDYIRANPDAPNEKAYVEAKEAGSRIIHFVQSAIEMAAQPLLELSAQSRIRSQYEASKASSISTTFQNEQQPLSAISENLQRVVKKREEKF